MAKLVAARAWCNNEVAYLVWKTDGKIDGCLGFMITRIHLDLNGQEVERRNLPTWVAFASRLLAETCLACRKHHERRAKAEIEDFIGAYEAIVCLVAD